LRVSLTQKMIENGLRRDCARDFKTESEIPGNLKRKFPPLPGGKGTRSPARSRRISRGPSDAPPEKTKMPRGVRFRSRRRTLTFQSRKEKAGDAKAGAPRVMRPRRAISRCRVFAKRVKCEFAKTNPTILTHRMTGVKCRAGPAFQTAFRGFPRAPGPAKTGTTASPTGDFRGSRGPPGAAGALAGSPVRPKTGFRPDWPRNDRDAGARGNAGDFGGGGRFGAFSGLFPRKRPRAANSRVFETVFRRDFRTRVSREAPVSGLFPVSPGFRSARGPPVRAGLANRSRGARGSGVRCSGCRGTSCGART
jgi:hypothetical protein